MSTSVRKNVATQQPSDKWAQNAIPLSERPTLTVDEFCRMVGIGRSTFYKAVGAGDLTVRKYGKRTFITQEELKRFIANMPTA
jgi:excisionase family DNA binding protein